MKINIISQIEVHTPKYFKQFLHLFSKKTAPNTLYKIKETVVCIKNNYSNLYSV